jgi:hypothetical protein
MVMRNEEREIIEISPKQGIADQGEGRTNHIALLVSENIIVR